MKRGQHAAERGAQRADHLVAVHAGQSDVAQDRVEVVIEAGPQAARAVEAAGDRVAVGLAAAGREHVVGIDVIFDHQDAARRRRRRPQRRRVVGAGRRATAAG